MNIRLGLVAGCALAVSATAAWADYAPVAADFPPNALPGHCYGKVLIPEVYTTYTDQIVDHVEQKETRIIPAVYGYEDRQVLVQEGRVEYTVVPATYKTITETVVIRQAGTRTETIPAVYETITERVLVREAYTVWKRGAAGPGQHVMPGSEKVLPTGEILCLVEIPAEYREVTRQVLKTAEQTRTIDIPAETSIVTRQVVDVAAHTVEHRIAPVYRTVKVQIVVHAESREVVTIPATYKLVTKQKLVTAARMEWRDIVCAKERAAEMPPPAAYHSEAYHSSVTETTTTYHAEWSSGGGNRTARMQAALAKRGYYKGPIDGRYTNEVGGAVMRFQHDNHLPAGYYNAETAVALGLPPRARFDREEVPGS